MGVNMFEQMTYNLDLVPLKQTEATRWWQ